MKTFEINCMGGIITTLYTSYRHRFLLTESEKVRITRTFIILSADPMKVKPGQEHCGLLQIQKSSKWCLYKGLKAFDISRV